MQSILNLAHHMKNFLVIYCLFLTAATMKTSSLKRILKYVVILTLRKDNDIGLYEMVRFIKSET